LKNNFGKVKGDSKVFIKKTIRKYLFIKFSYFYIIKLSLILPQLVENIDSQL